MINKQMKIGMTKLEHLIEQAPKIFESLITIELVVVTIIDYNQTES